MNQKKKKVLIAEDNVDILFVLEAGLEEYEIITACDGKEALSKIRESAPEIIILDIMMPDINGADMNRELKKDPQLKDIPVIIITGRTNMRGLFSEDGENAVAGFLEKPFSIDVLRSEIKRILEK